MIRSCQISHTCTRRTGRGMRRRRESGRGSQYLFLCILISSQTNYCRITRIGMQCNTGGPFSRLLAITPALLHQTLCIAMLWIANETCINPSIPVFSYRTPSFSQQNDPSLCTSVYLHPRNSVFCLLAMSK